MVLRVLNVAEKNSVAKAVTQILSNGRARSLPSRWVAGAHHSHSPAAACVPLLPY
jgi:hypothetical protein